ncbi:hypothetical protein ACK3BK_07655 [Pseudomonas sp. L7]|uniref:hypothetical protein n=1 Tax=Pseudomonas sp. L7 TaxID=3388343 RepID=UPI00398500F0
MDPEYAAYYANNLNFGKYDPTAETLGSVAGVGTALGDMLKGMYGLGKGLLTDTQNTASQVSHQLINSLSHPEAVVQEWQDMRAEATLYRLQGNPTAAARVEAEWQTKFVMNLVPVGKAGKLSQVSKTVAEREAIAEAVGGATGRQVPGLPSYYRDGSGVGANVVAPEGYTAVVNLRTGNFEFVAPDGKLYFYSESALVPKEGGNLAGLAAAEREIAAGKAGGGAKATGGAVELTFDKATRTWTTPAGLDYGQGSVQGNRVLHVLEHAEPNPAKTTHSVFSMDRKEILGAVDEAWLKKGSPVVGDPGAYVVPMGRALGTSGETSIKIIVRPGTNQVITAYPIK